MRGGRTASQKLRRAQLLLTIREFFIKFTMFALRIDLNIIFNVLERSEFSE